jgi:alanine-glyoxylate transaminase/serine-glyoxylate transaminase/serine-pyruvate transaminase
MPDRVLQAMHRAAPNIYEGDLMGLTETIYRDLNRIARNSGHAVIYIGNGHASWEACLCNTLSRGDRILGLVTGRFGRGWIATAEALDIEVQVLDFGSTASVDPATVQATLEADKGHLIKAVITVQTDTSTSTSNDIAGIRQAMSATAHPALLMVDCIASFACEPFDMDAWGVDVMLTASQKGLMTPPGLGIVFIRDTVWPLHETADLKTPYWDWGPRARPAFYAARFCGTAPTHHLFGLREALDMLLEEGMENVWNRHRVQAEAVWAAVDAWGAGGAMNLNVTLPSDRSLAVTTVNTEPGLAPRLRSWCELNTGLTLGIGLTPTPSGLPVNNIFRIGHMGHLNPHALLGTLGSIEAGLIALGVDAGSGGTQAALQLIARTTATD